MWTMAPFIYAQYLFHIVIAFFIFDILNADLLQEYRNFLVESASDAALKWPPTD